MKQKQKRLQQRWSTHAKMEQDAEHPLPSRKENIRTFIYYLIGALLPLIFISIWATLLDNGTVTLEGDDPYTFWIYFAFSFLITLNYLSIRKLGNRLVHLIIGVILPIGAFLVMRVMMIPAIFSV